MALPSPETVWHSSDKELYTLLDSDRLVSKPKTAHFYTPGFTYYKTTSGESSPNRFPTVSVTAAACSLNCKHCESKVLQTMQAATTPEKLLSTAKRIKQNGALGFLLSGGCLPNGSVPLKPFIPTLERIKRELGLTVFVHTGLIDLPTAQSLKKAGVDAALIDVIGSNATIKQVYSLNATTRDYSNSLKALSCANLNFVPHIIVGLHFGKLKGELKALKMVAATKPTAVVIVAFMPIHKTAMANVKPPEPTDIAKVAAASRLMFPQTPLGLGCMRPKGKHRTFTDVLALKAGLDAIAFPSEEAIAYARTQGYATSFSPYCCAQIYMDSPLRRSSK